MILYAQLNALQADTKMRHWHQLFTHPGILYVDSSWIVKSVERASERTNKLFLFLSLRFLEIGGKSAQREEAS